MDKMYWVESNTYIYGILRASEIHKGHSFALRLLSRRRRGPTKPVLSLCPAFFRPFCIFESFESRERMFSALKALRTDDLFYFTG